MLRHVPDAGSQTSLAILFRAVPELDPAYVALVALLRVLDDGMSTRLHYTLADQKGLAYSIHAAIEPLADTALFEITRRDRQRQGPVAGARAARAARRPAPAARSPTTSSPRRASATATRPSPRSTTPPRWPAGSAAPRCTTRRRRCRSGSPRCRRSPSTTSCGSPSACCPPSTSCVAAVGTLSTRAARRAAPGVTDWR